MNIILQPVTLFHTVFTLNPNPTGKAGLHKSFIKVPGSRVNQQSSPVRGLDSDATVLQNATPVYRGLMHVAGRSNSQGRSQNVAD